MDSTTTDEEFGNWFSTYSLITAERILSGYGIALAQAELVEAMKTPSSFYRGILYIPFHHVLNGIVIQQASDYHVYAQKLFIDYMLSGECEKEAGAQGGSTRDNLERERNALVELGDAFNQFDLDHKTLIAETQRYLINALNNWREIFESLIKSLNKICVNITPKIPKSDIRRRLHYALIRTPILTSQTPETQAEFVNVFLTSETPFLDANLSEKTMDVSWDLFQAIAIIHRDMDDFIEKTDAIGRKAQEYRTDFYNTILRINEFLRLLPDYRMNPVQDEVNRENLYFDRTIGES